MNLGAARVLTRALDCIGFESIWVATVAKTLSPPPGTVQAVCQVQNEPLRYRLDGEAPTAATGVEALSGAELALDGAQNMAAFQFIRHGDSNPGGKLVCHYYK